MHSVKRQTPHLGFAFPINAGLAQGKLHRLARLVTLLPFSLEKRKHTTFIRLKKCTQSNEVFSTYVCAVKRFGPETIFPQLFCAK